MKSPIAFRWIMGAIPKAGQPQEREAIENAYLGYRQSLRRGMDGYLLLGDPNARKTSLQGMLKLIQML